MIITQAVQDVIVRGFQSELMFGKGDWAYGTDEELYSPGRVMHLEHSKKAAREGSLTFADLVTGQLYCALASENPAELRHQLVCLAAEVVDWIEAIDRKAGLTE